MSVTEPETTRGTGPTERGTAAHPPGPPAVIAYDRSLTVIWRNATALGLADRAAPASPEAMACLAGLGTQPCGLGCPVLQTRADGRPHFGTFAFADGRTRRLLRRVRLGRLVHALVSVHLGLVSEAATA